MEKDLKLIQLFFDNLRDTIDGLYAISLVEYPAIEKNLMFYDKFGIKNSLIEKNKFLMANTSEIEQGYIVSPVMIPGKKILAIINDELVNTFYDEKTVFEASEFFMKKNYNHNITEQHINPINDVNIIHSWIVENQSDSIITKYGFTEIPDGTWVVRMKVDNEDIKRKIKSGEIKGLSIEAWFSLQYSENQLLNGNKIILEKIKQILIKMS